MIAPALCRGRFILPEFGVSRAHSRLRLRTSQSPLRGEKHRALTFARRLMARGEGANAPARRLPAPRRAPAPIAATPDATASGRTRSPPAGASRQPRIPDQGRQQPWEAARARAAAAGHIDLSRVRRRWQEILQAQAGQPDAPSAGLAEALGELMRLDQCERKAVARLSPAMWELDHDGGRTRNFGCGF